MTIDVVSLLSSSTSGPFMLQEHKTPQWLLAVAHAKMFTFLTLLDEYI